MVLTSAISAVRAAFLRCRVLTIINSPLDGLGAHSWTPTGLTSAPMQNRRVTRQFRLFAPPMIVRTIQQVHSHPAMARSAPRSVPIGMCPSAGVSVGWQTRIRFSISSRRILMPISAMREFNVNIPDPSDLISVVLGGSPGNSPFPNSPTSLSVKLPDSTRRLEPRWRWRGQSWWALVSEAGVSLDSP